VERRRADLEQQADHEQRDAGDDEPGVARLRGEGVGDAAQLDGAGEAVEQRRAEQEEGRGVRAQDEVLERGLLREQSTAARQAGEHVERQRHDLERHEHGEQVGRCREEQHAADAEQEQRPHLGLEPAEAGEGLLVLRARQRRCARCEGVAGRVDLALGHDHRRDEREHEDRALHEQRGTVDRDRALGHHGVGAAGVEHGDETADERAEDDHELDRAAVLAGQERLDQDGHHGGAEHHEDRHDRRVLDGGGLERGRRGGEDGAHF